VFNLGQSSGLLKIVLPVAGAIVAMAAFQLGAVAAKGLFPAVGPIGAATLRLVVGAMLLLVIVRPWRGWRRGADIRPLVGLGICVAGVIIMFFKAMEHLPLGIAISLQFLGPLAVAIIGSRRPVHLLCAAGAATGVWLLTGIGLKDDLDPVGLMWGFGAAVCWGSYILFGRAASIAFGASSAAWSIAIAAIVVAPIGAYHSGTALLSPDLIPLALLVALLSVAIPFSLEIYALGLLPPRTFAILMSAEPSFGVLFGLLFLDETLTMTQAMGVTAVIVSAAIAAATSRDPPPPVST
jgi:inner membrane transporter RhtA